MKFDTNNLHVRPVPPGASPVADLNFSPNVVFSPDSRKAFVSYPSSDKVAVFDPKTGEIEKEGYGLVQVGENPALITLTADGKKVAVVCLFIEDNLPQVGEDFLGKRIGSISIIDVETLVVKTLDLKGVFFSFANNVVFSGDGKTGFIASSGTDEILRFDVESATEITSRLKMDPGTRPSSITMAPDFSFFAVVLVGSSSLSQLEVPDSIQIIDLNSFSVVRSILPKAEENRLPHNFVVANTLAISADAKFGLIADQENSSVSAVPSLTIDHGILLDLETGETVTVFDVGGLSGASFSVPGRKRFVTISELSVTVMDIESPDSFRVNPFPADFQPTTRSAFSKDGARMFLAAPLRDVLLVVDLDKRVVTRSLDIGPGVELESNGQKFTVPAAPLDVALSPDETVLTALKFNANTIDLLQETQRFFIPRLLSSEQWFTGVAVTNNSPSQAEIFVKGFDKVGIEFQDLTDTEDIVEFVNPNTIELGAGRQISFTAAELLQAAPGTSIDGWLDFDSDQLQMSSFLLLGDPQLRRQEGGLAVFETSQLMILPEVRVTGGFVTEIDILNPNVSRANVTISLLNSKGEVIENIDRSLVARQVFTGFLRDPNPDDNLSEGLFSEDAFVDFAGGYVSVSSTAGIVAFERYYDDQRLAALNGIGAAAGVELPRASYVPQVVAFGGSQTFVNLINTGTEKAQVTVSLFYKDPQGEDRETSVPLEMESGEVIRENLVDLFNLANPGSIISGWLLIKSNIPGIIGDAEIQAFSGRAMTTIPAQGSPTGNFVFSHVVQGLGLSTGLAFVNPGAVTANVRLEVYAGCAFQPSTQPCTGQAALLDSVTLSIGPSQREVGLLKEFFPKVSELLGGHIKVTSEQEIVGLELFFADSLEYLAAVPAQPITQGVRP
ncbi:hypothetical protein MYX65_03895 [Acidobacteria bacterium AH-259-L09]|nr:hypothetical protein [Acidobacteria bacterium AH-259-L09]